MSKALVVDDAAIMRIKLQDILEKNNYEVVALAENGLEALELFSKHKPDFVTLDISMPEMDGIQVLKKIMELDGQAKVMMVSAVGQMQMVIKALSIGAKDFIVKPFDEERVIEAIERILKK